MIKKIKIFFINKHIKKTQKEIDKLHKEIKWLQQHLHDTSLIESFNYVKAIDTQLKIYKAELRLYEKDKERLMNNG